MQQESVKERGLRVCRLYVEIEHGPRGLVGTGTNQDGKYEPNRVLIGTSSSNTKPQDCLQIRLERTLL